MTSFLKQYSVFMTTPTIWLSYVRDVPMGHEYDLDYLPLCTYDGMMTQVSAFFSADEEAECNRRWSQINWGWLGGGIF